MTIAPNPVTATEIAQNLISTATDQYAAWFLLDGGLMVGKRSRSSQTWTTHEITGAAATALALPETEGDTHHFPAIAVDSSGYIHLWAHMHSDPLRYIVSDNPGDITAWSAGTLPNSGTFTRWTYPIPVMCPDGSIILYFRAGPAGVGSGQANSYTWTHNGTAWTGPTMLFQGIDVNGGSGAGNDDLTNWSAYPAFPHVEDLGAGAFRVHWAWLWRELALDGRSCILPSYAYYDSATDAWYDVTGTAVTLPIDPLNDPAVQTGMVDGGEGYINTIGLALDGNGHPIINVSQGPTYQITWNGSAWSQVTIAQPLGGHSWSFGSRPIRLRGSTWYLDTSTTANPRRPRLWKADGATGVTMGGSVGTASGWNPHHDPEALRRHGSVEILVPNGDTPRVFTFGNHARMTAAA